MVKGSKQQLEMFHCFQVRINLEKTFLLTLLFFPAYLPFLINLY